MFKNILQNKRLTIVLSAVIVIFVVLPIVIFIIVQRPFSENQTPVEKAISQKIDRGDFDTDIIMTEGDWTLAKFSVNDDGTKNSAYVILHKENEAEKIILGPGTYIGVELLVENKIPDKIIRYFYQGTLWVRMIDFTSEYSANWGDYAETYIVAYMTSLRVDLDRVIIVKDSVYGRVENQRTDAAQQVAGFKFTVNDDPTVYQLEITMSTSLTTVRIFDSDKKELFTKSFPTR